MIVIGREDDSRPGLINIDLCGHTGGQFGVSRQHLMITYSPDMQLLTVMDLNSTNGSWVNNQRLYGPEVEKLSWTAINPGQCANNIRYQNRNRYFDSDNAKYEMPFGLFCGSDNRECLELSSYFLQQALMMLG